MSYWLYRTLALLPLSALYRVSSALAWLLGNLFRYRRRVIEDNLSRAFPNRSSADRSDMRRKFYSHLTDTTLEIIAGYRLPHSAFGDRVAIDNPEVLTRLSDHYQRSVIVLTIHQGNWEWMLQRAMLEFPIAQAAVYKRLHSPGADRFSYENRSRFGAEPIEMRDTSRNLIRHRRTPRLIFMVADQSPGKRERVVWTDFLNQPTAFFSGAAALARATGFPVAFAGCQRTSRGHYRIHLEEITASPADMSEDEIIGRYAHLAEQAIQRAPEEWLWSNRRWKLQPVAET